MYVVCYFKCFTWIESFASHNPVNVSTIVISTLQMKKLKIELDVQGYTTSKCIFLVNVYIYLLMSLPLKIITTLVILVSGITYDAHLNMYIRQCS